jgi:hypothetical protein
MTRCICVKHCDQTDATTGHDIGQSDPGACGLLSVVSRRSPPHRGVGRGRGAGRGLGVGVDPGMGVGVIVAVGVGVDVGLAVGVGVGVVVGVGDDAGTSKA